jgi:hypothetical protein
MNEKELKHFGVLGMHWGVRKGTTWGQRIQVKVLKRDATKDAKKFAEAKMDFGEGAGIKRRHVKAALEVKFRDPNYKKSFDEALAAIDYHKATKKAKGAHNSRVVKKESTRGLKMVAKTLTGTTSIAAAYILYSQNKPLVDSAIKKVLNKQRR